MEWYNKFTTYSIKACSFDRVIVPGAKFTLYPLITHLEKLSSYTSLEIMIRVLFGDDRNIKNGFEARRD